MDKFYTYFLSTIITSSLCCIEFPPLSHVPNTVPRELSQCILLEQFNYIPAPQDSFHDDGDNKTNYRNLFSKNME